jgi:ABC-type branched-subunit amino acid transport system ATPase component
MSRVLEVNGLEGGYGAVKILYGVSLHVDEGEFVTVIGPNGCGKSTFLKILFGLATHYTGSVIHNSIDVSAWRTDRLVERGISYVPQVDNVFPTLSVFENLQMGGIRLPARVLSARIDRAFDMFPAIARRERDLAESLSGGERQMLAISRALISDPTFLLLDEPTAALSPIYQEQILTAIDDLRNNGISILLVEQNARLSLSKSDRGYIFVAGKIAHEGVAQGVAQEMIDDPKIGEYFLGFQD